MKRIHVNIISLIFTVIYKNTKWDSGEGRGKEVEEGDELGEKTNNYND